MNGSRSVQGCRSTGREGEAWFPAGDDAGLPSPDGATALPARLRTLRSQLGISQTRLAELLDVSPLSVLRWEHGRTRPSAATLLRLRRVEAGVGVVDQPEVDEGTGWEAGGGETSTALPRFGSPFVGRTRELETLSDLIRTERLLTLTGPPGSGKTRLALALAEAPEAYAGNVWFVGLAPLASAEQLGPALAAAAGVPAEPLETLVDRVARAIGDSPGLLLLDSCERLSAAVADVVIRMLAAAPRLHVLATSLQPLRATHEHVWPLSPLSLPAPVTVGAVGHTEVAAIAGSEAAQLFAARARRGRPDFALDRNNAVAVAEICIRLDGLPLAIELAAARVRTLSPAQIATHLDDSLRLLTDVDADAPRHRSLRAAIEWGHTLLTPPEQQLLRRLSVFPGGFTLEAMAAVALQAGEWPEAAHPLDVLTGLVERSFVEVVRRGDDQDRFALLDTMRAYAAEQLRRSGEEQATKDRHARYVVALAQEAEDDLAGAQQDAWLARLEHERPNLLAALSHLAETGDGPRLLACATALWRFWHLRGYAGEGRRWLSLALDAADLAPDTLRARALNAAGWLAREQRDFSAARELLGQAVALCERADDRPDLARALSNLGSVAYEQGDLATARRYYERSLALYRELRDQRNIAILLNNLAQSLPLDEQAAARPLYEESLAISRAGGDKTAMVLALNNLGLLAYAVGALTEAHLHYQEALGLSRALGYRYGEAIVLTNMGHLALAEGRHAAARRLHADSLELMQRAGYLGGAVHVLRSLAAVDARLGRHCDAARWLGAAEATGAGESVPVPQPYLAEHARTLELVRSGAPADEIARCRGEGAGLSAIELLTLARACADDPPTAPADATASPLVRLSTREQEIMQLLIAGRSNQLIARQLVLSIRTVEHHVARICAKLGAGSRAEAVAVALRLGTVHEPDR